MAGGDDAGDRFVDGARAGWAPGAPDRLAVLTGAAGGPRGARELLDAVFALEPAAFLRRIPGRETFLWRPAGASDGPGVVVKRFATTDRRDGWYERLRGRAVRGDGRRECENLWALAADGFTVPAGLAWAEDRDGRSLCVMDVVPHTETARDRLDAHDPGERRALAARIVELAARLHARGWYHRDLYLQHLVLGPADALVLLDVGRARHERAPRRRWFVKDLAALLHSAPPALTRGETLRGLRDYLTARDDATEFSAWARDVEAKRRRIAAHRPRHVDPRTALGPDGDAREGVA